MAARSKSEIAQLQEAFLICRVRRHAWEDIPDDGGLRRQWTESRTVARLQQRCTRCGTVRAEAWNRITGEILFAQYRYPEGYQLANLNGYERSVINKDLRKEFLKRK